MYYVCVAFELRTGETEVIRAHTDINPICLDQRGQADFMANVIRAQGLDLADVACTGGALRMEVSVWSTESECKAAYDAAVRRTRPRALRPMDNVRPAIMPTEALISAASELHASFADLLDEPQETWGAAFTDRVNEDQNERGIDFARLCSLTPEGVLSTFALLKWADAGFPKIVMGHRFAASLLVTSASAEAVDAARPPFPAFILELPDKLIAIDSPEGEGELLHVRRVIVTTLPDPKGIAPFNWGFTAHAEGGVCVWRSGIRSSDMQPASSEEIEGLLTDAFDFQTTGRDERVLALLGRLIINTCLAMSDPSQVRTVGSSHVAWKANQSKGARRGSPEPVVRVFQVGRPVTHDFREAVQEYLGGERRKLSVQCVVAGHYKMQPHGYRNSLRKLIWREPYWRGPEDAPIVVRPHKLSDRLAKTTGLGEATPTDTGTEPKAGAS